MSCGLHSTPKYDARGRGVFCGPQVIAAATGISIGKACAHMNRRIGRAPHLHISGTDSEDLKCALEQEGVGYHFERKARAKDRPTFAQWRKREQHSRQATYILGFTSHWVVVKGDWLCDTTHIEPHDLSAKPVYSRARVEIVFRLK